MHGASGVSCLALALHVWGPRTTTELALAPQAVTSWRNTQQLLLDTRETDSKAQAARAVQEASMGYVSR